MINELLTRTPNRSEKGQSITELALTLGFLLLLLSGIVDIGRAFFTYMSLRDAAQEGALYGSISPADTMGVKNHVIHSSDYVQGLVSVTDIQVNLDGPACAGNGIEVIVTEAAYPLAMPFLGAIIGSQTVSISARVTDTILRPPCN